jgi:uncharacterized protein (DUF2252 family)
MPATARKQTEIISGSTRLTRPERLKKGHDQRNHLSRTKLGDAPKRARAFNPIELLLGSTEGRVPELLPIKYQRMRVSPFAFFRGAVSIMAADLASQPNTGLTVQLCGDAHVQNLGCFAAPDSKLVFDINDFDETIAGPWEWDVKRMACSIMLAGVESGHARPGCSSAVEAFAGAYCKTIEQLAEEPILNAARFLIHRIKQAQPISAALKQAERASPCDLLKKYTASTRDGIQFKHIEHQIWRLKDNESQAVLQCLPHYRESLAGERLHWFEFFRPLDVAFKVVGTGSVGLRDYVVLMQGNGSKDPRFLQIKQEVASAYAPYLKHAHFPNQGQRVVEGQRKIQPQSDLLLGWTRIGAHDYLVRQLNDHKGSIDLKNLRALGLNSLGIIAAELLARGHARSGDALAIKGYIGNCDKILKSIVRFAVDYAAIAEQDFGAFQKAIDDGRVNVTA